MSLPYHRGQINNKNNMSYRGNNQWGTKNQIADEANRNLLEEENDRRWSDLGLFIYLFTLYIILYNIILYINI